MDRLPLEDGPPTAPRSAPTEDASTPLSIVRALSASVVAACVNTLLWWVGRAAGASLTIASPAYSTISAAMTALASFLLILIAALVVWLVARRRPGFRRTARWLGSAVAILSMLSPILLARDTATAVTLAAMHVVAAVCWFLAVRAPRAEVSTGSRS